MTTIQIKINDGSIITPSNINILGYHIIGKDDKIVLSLPSNISKDRFEEIERLLDAFSTDNSLFLLLSSDVGVMILKKEA